MSKEQQLAELELTIKRAKQQIEELKKAKVMFERGSVDYWYFYVDVNFTLSKTTEKNHTFDNAAYNNANYYLEKDKHIAERVAKYYQDNNWFIRAAITFADGYEFVDGGENCFIYWCLEYKNWSVIYNNDTRNKTTIYMTKENAQKFKAWLEEYKPEGI